MNRTLYSALVYFLSPLLLIYLAIRAIKTPDYRGRWKERFGLNKIQQTDLLIHCVSVGETFAAIPLINKVMEENPSLTITITTTSPTGSAEVIKAFGSKVQHCYLPFDLACCVKRFLAQLRPKYCIIVETELWPNLIHQIQHQGTMLMLANARLSAKSATTYHRWQTLFLPVLRAIDVIAAQSDKTAERFIALGVAKKKVVVTGSLKFNLPIKQGYKNEAVALRAKWHRVDLPVWIAGSVHPGEFAAILQAHKIVLDRYPKALLVMVPRHPEQFNAADAAVSAAQLTLARRSKPDSVSSDTQVLLGDTMGELLSFYGAADQAFVGGTLIERGGHNPLEPASMGLPVFVGPHYWNFAEITEMLDQAGALTVVHSATELGRRLLNLFDDKQAYQDASAAGFAVVDANKGGVERQFDLVQQLINS